MGQETPQKGNYQIYNLFSYYFKYIIISQTVIYEYIFIYFKIIVYRNYFEFEYIIGRGGFSKVWQVKLKKNSKKYALKQMSKVKIIDKRSEKSILCERDLLSKLKHPFIVNMICSFQDYENLYLLMDLLTGGDLRYHFNSNHIFLENEIRFFISCIILSLEYIHENKVIHRDIKPENLVYDDKGYVRLTDFGIAKILKEENNTETSGTPGYMAPEVLMSQNQSFTVDFYAIGVIGYEFLMGKRPYVGKNRKEIKQLVLSKEVSIDENDNKEKLWSKECIDFINRCLKRKIINRLGYHFGIKELKTHPWFAKFDWLNLYSKKLTAPYIPKNEKNYDQKYCESIDKISNSTFERYKNYMRKNDYLKKFEGYTYFNNDMTSNTLENETVTRVSTSTKGNKQELLDNQTSYVNLQSSIHNEKYYSITPLKNMIDSSISYNRYNNSVEQKLMSLDKNKDESKNIENYQYHLRSNWFDSIRLMKENDKRLMNKKQISYDILNFNKEIREEINSRVTENNFKEENSSVKKDSSELKNINNSNSNNLNLIDKNINVSNDIINNNGYNININNSVNIVEKNDKDINAINNNLKEYNILNKIKKRNISKNSSLIEKQIQANNEQFGKNMNNVSIINFRKFKKKKLNIHSLSTGVQKKDEFNEDSYKENKIEPIYLPPLNKINKNNNNDVNNNKSQNLPMLLSNIRHFKFKISKKKRIKQINFNQNKIIENINKSTEEHPKGVFQLFSNLAPKNGSKIMNNDISEEKKSEIYKKLLDNNKLKNIKIKLGKSPSPGLFPKIMIS